LGSELRRLFETPGYEKTRSSATAKSTARQSCLVGGFMTFLVRKSVDGQPLSRNWPRKLPNSAK